MYSKVRGEIHRAIFKNRNEEDWENYKLEIIKSLNEINLKEKIENYEACGRALWVKRPEMRTLIRGIVYLNRNIFKEVGHETYLPKTGYNISWEEINDLIEYCVKLLVKKQQCK